jgi:electron transport complex protein RnfG
MARKTKVKSTLLSMTLTLLIVSAVSAAILAYIYKITKEPIKEADLKKQKQALLQVLPKFDNNPIADADTIPSDIPGKDYYLVVFPAFNHGKLVGVAIKSFTLNGFNGRFDIMVGFLPDGTIYNTLPIHEEETPGLGDKIDPAKSNFTKQFKGKNPKTFILKVTKDGGDVDAITAATISSRAYCDALQRAYNAFKKLDLSKLKSK